MILGDTHLMRPRHSATVRAAVTREQRYEPELSRGADPTRRRAFSFRPAPRRARNTGPQNHWYVELFEFMQFY